MSLAQDVAHLKDNPSLETKAEITEKISHYYNFNMFDAKEQKIAQEIIRLLAKDSSALIRKIITKNLKECEALPRDISRKLAEDLDDDVALPILEFSSVLTQEDLIEIVRSTKQVTRLKAIGNRKDVGEALADALVDKDILEVIETLLLNVSSKINDNTLTHIVERYHAEGHLIETLVSRGSLSPVVIAKVMTTVSDSIRHMLRDKYNLDNDISKELTEGAFEESMMDLFANPKQRSQTEALVKQLHNEDALTSTVIFRALCRGDLYFFIEALAKLTDEPIRRIHRIVVDKAMDEFDEIYQSADLPSVAHRATSIVWPMVVDLVKEGAVEDKTLSTRLKEQIEEEGYHSSVPMMRHFLVFINTQKS